MAQKHTAHRIKTSFPQKIALICIRGYQSFRPYIDSLHYSVFGYVSSCKHSPTCSEHVIETILKYGTMRGIVLGVKKIIACR